MKEQKFDLLHFRRLLLPFFVQQFHSPLLASLPLLFPSEKSTKSKSQLISCLTMQTAFRRTTSAQENHKTLILIHI